MISRTAIALRAVALLATLAICIIMMVPMILNSLGQRPDAAIEVPQLRMADKALAERLDKLEGKVDNVSAEIASAKGWAGGVLAILGLMQWRSRRRT